MTTTTTTAQASRFHVLPQAAPVTNYNTTNYTDNTERNHTLLIIGLALAFVIALGLGIAGFSGAFTPATVATANATVKIAESHDTRAGIVALANMGARFGTNDAETHLTAVPHAGAAPAYAPAARAPAAAATHGSGVATMDGPGRCDMDYRGPYAGTKGFEWPDKRCHLKPPQG